MFRRAWVCGFCSQSVMVRSCAPSLPPKKLLAYCPRFPSLFPFSLFHCSLHLVDSPPLTLLPFLSQSCISDSFSTYSLSLPNFSAGSLCFSRVWTCPLFDSESLCTSHSLPWLLLLFARLYSYLSDKRVHCRVYANCFTRSSPSLPLTPPPSSRVAHFHPCVLVRWQ